MQQYSSNDSFAYYPDAGNVLIKSLLVLNMTESIRTLWKIQYLHPREVQIRVWRTNGQEWLV